MPKFSEGHYEDIARIFRNCPISDGPILSLRTLQKSQEVVLLDMIRSFGQLFADDNPEFDWEKWDKACGWR